MNFTKEQAREKIAQRFTENAEEQRKWERTISENVETLFALLGEDANLELDDFVEKAIPIFSTTAGFLRKENATVAKSFEAKISELENSAKNAKSEQQTIVEKTDKVDEITRAYEERLAKLEARIAKQDEYEVMRTKRAEIIDGCKRKGVKDTSVIERLLEKATIGAETDTNSEIDYYVKTYNEIMSGVNPNATPSNAGGGSEDKRIKAVLDAASSIVSGESLL